MAEHGVRVALLARDGQARERLQEALREAGAQLVAVVDPLTADPGEVASKEPQGVLVALEPAIEDALEAWDALLSDPSLIVIFDEVELAASRSGWDAARWIRHLRAKLLRHDDVLPPGAEPEGEWQPEPGALQQPVVEGLEEEFRSIEDEAQGNAAEVPADEGLEAWLERMSSAAADANLDSAAGPDSEDARAADPPAVAAASGMFSNLELVDPEVPVTDASPGEDDADTRLAALEERIAGLSLADGDNYSRQSGPGAVLVEAGLGGPDAVRQLLGALGERFPRPLLVRLRLEGGRYERLVRQMDRATPLSVILADEGVAIETGRVYFLPEGMDVVADDSRLKFVRDESALQRLPSGLAADDSAVLFMSGADAALVGQALQLGEAGALVLGQSAEASFDAAAAQRLMEHGGSAIDAAAIAARLQERWPPQIDQADAGMEEQQP
ncbi:chemotaxis protein CheB [Luteimonas sp. A478]